jgi:hypothetical protein
VKELYELQNPDTLFQNDKKNNAMVINDLNKNI